MKRMIWKLRFALHMSKRTKETFSFGWKSAEVWLESYPDDIAEQPEYCCDEELSHWEFASE